MREPVPPEIVHAELDAPDLDPAALAEAIADEHEPAWAPPDPATVARDFIRRNPDAQVEIIWPTVYEEDRSSKIADLVNAEGVGVISHERAAEQVAKELGFAQYDYAAEQEQIAREKKIRTLTPTPDADDADAAVEGLQEDIARCTRLLTQLTEAVLRMPPPIQVQVPETRPPDIVIQDAAHPTPRPAGPRLVTVERDQRGLITRLVEER